MSDETAIQAAWEALEVSQKWAAAWKGFAKRTRRMIVKEMVQMQETHRQLVDIMDKARTNPGLLLAGLTMEAAQQGMELGNLASECMGWAFAHYLSNHPEAPNYLEVTLTGVDQEPIYVTVQRPGGKTPHQLRMAAEAERDRLRSELEALKAQGPCRS